MKFTIWQRYRSTKRWGNSWGLWCCTHYKNLQEVVARHLLAEIEADELERRQEFPGTEAVYEIRVST